MDYKKLDAALAGELERTSREASLNVFVHATAPLSAGQTAELASIGVAGQPGERILTASIAPEVVSKLSELPWIEHISLAKTRRPL
jgi:hypothetical protein